MTLRTRIEAAGKRSNLALASLRIVPRARRRGQLIRDLWKIENSQHWVLDVTFREDSRRVHQDHGPENLAALNRLALSLIKRHPGKDRISGRRKMGGWDDELSLAILRGKPRNPAR